MDQKSQYEERFKELIGRLNPAQNSAVEQIEGPVIVIAGPGTGKTQILSARIGNILWKTDTEPHNILCLTYTDAGTIAMRERLLDFIGPVAYNVHIYTFHAFCNSVIQENLDYFGIRDLQPITDLESVELYQKLIDNFSPDHPLKRFSGDVYFEISRLKNLFQLMKKEGWTSSFIEARIDEYLTNIMDYEGFVYKRANSKRGIKAGDPHEKNIAEATRKMEMLRAAAREFDNFQQLMRDNHRYDYHDMILWVLKAFEENEAILLRYQEQYHYFLVDEYQDTNGAQNQVLDHLSNFWDVPNTFVVGDDDQAIYRFQGANVANILDFHDKHAASISQVVLEENYRSSQAILDASQAVISHNEERLINKIDGLTKDLIAKGRNAGSPILPRVDSYPTTMAEETGIVKAIEGLRTSGEKLSEVAIIYRSHRQVENLIKVFESKGIPLNVKQQLDILKLPFVQKLITILKYLQSEYEEPDSGEPLLFQIMHYDFFKISSRDAARISRALWRKKKGEKMSWRELLGSKERLYQLGLETATAISNLEENLTYWIKAVPNITLQNLFEKVITRGNVLESIMKSEDKSFYMQVLTSFFNFIKEEHARTPSMKLKDLLSIIDRMERHNIALGLNKIVSSEDGVNLVTAHSSKGLEYNHVFLIGAQAKSWEGKGGGRGQYSMPPTIVEDNPENKEEEERRLFYVAMTRAKEHLHISFAEQTNEGKALERSRFVVELLEHNPHLLAEVQIPQEEILAFNFHLLASNEDVRVELMDENLINEALKNFRLSVTALNKFLRCPLAFYFENVVKVPTARSDNMGFGNAVHYSLEQFFKEMMASEIKQFPSLDRLLELFKKGMEIYKSHFTPEGFALRMEFADQVLPDYYAEYIESWNKVTILEYDIKHAQLGGVPLSGKLDKLEFDNNEVNVVDYKTGNADRGRDNLRGPTPAKPEGGEYWRQLVFYKILMDNDRTKPWQVVSGEMDFIQKSKQGGFIKQKVNVSAEDVALVSAQIKEVYARIMKHEFDQGCQDEGCQWCNFVKYNFDGASLQLEEESINE